MLRLVQSAFLMRNAALLSKISIILLFVLGVLPASYAQNLGQSGGSLNFNVSLGGSQTLNYSIFNAGSQPITFHMLPPQFAPIPHNATPAVIVSPSNGTLQPQESQTIYVTVNMPSNDSIGLRWDNIIQVIAASNVSNPGGAVIQGGLGKEIIIYSKKPKSNPFAYIAALVIALIIIMGIAAYYMRSSRRRSATRTVGKSKGKKASGSKSASKK